MSLNCVIASLVPSLPALALEKAEVSRVLSFVLTAVLCRYLLGHQSLWQLFLGQRREFYRVEQESVQLPEADITPQV